MPLRDNRTHTGNPFRVPVTKADSLSLDHNAHAENLPITLALHLPQNLVKTAGGLIRFVPIEYLPRRWERKVFRA